jgi:hypothetical protein
MDNLDEFEAYDDLLFEPLAQQGWMVDLVSWRDRKADWDKYEAVIIRSPWDYQQDAELFMNVLKEIDQSTARLENTLDLVKWNIDKNYLRELEHDGILIVPTLWGEKLDRARLFESFEVLNSKEVVVKPTISANADDTFRIKQTIDPDTEKEILRTFNNRPYMIQPFMKSIVTEGEFSLFYFGGQYSHTILKTPKQGDFRVQEEHGGVLTTVEPETLLLERARKTMQEIRPQPLYARADYVRTDTNDFALMELELIEPSLYFNMDPDSPERFAKVFDRWMKEKKKQAI